MQPNCILAEFRYEIFDLTFLVDHFFWHVKIENGFYLHQNQNVEALHYKMQDKRHRLISDFIAAESNYISSLELLVAFKGAVQQAASNSKSSGITVSQQDLATVFADVENILSVHNNLQSLIKQIKSNTSQSQEETLAESFIKMVPFFKCYQYFFNEVSARMHTAQQWEQHKKLSALLSQVQKDNNTSETLGAALTKPTVRVSRSYYYMLQCCGVFVKIFFNITFIVIVIVTIQSIYQ